MRRQGFDEGRDCIEGEVWMPMDTQKDQNPPEAKGEKETVSPVQAERSEPEGSLDQGPELEPPSIEGVLTYEHMHLRCDGNKWNPISAWNGVVLSCLFCNKGFAHHHDAFFTGNLLVFGISASYMICRYCAVNNFPKRPQDLYISCLR